MAMATAFSVITKGGPARPSCAKLRGSETARPSAPAANRRRGVALTVMPGDGPEGSRRRVQFRSVVVQQCHVAPRPRHGPLVGERTGEGLTSADVTAQLTDHVVGLSPHGPRPSALRRRTSSPTACHSRASLGRGRGGKVVRTLATASLICRRTSKTCLSGHLARRRSQQFSPPPPLSTRNQSGKWVELCFPFRRVVGPL